MYAKRLLGLFTCVILYMGAFGEARDPYHSTIFVGPASAKAEGPNMVVLINELKTSAIEKVIPFYTPTTPAALTFNLRGINAFGSFAANSTTFNVVIPKLGVNQSFTGATRDESLALYKQFIRDNGNRGGMLPAYAKYTSVDPIAGNPNSLMYQMAQADYLYGRLSPLTGCDCCWSSQPVIHQFQVGAQFNRGFADKFETTAITVPLRYSYSPDLTWAFIVDVPITLMITGGAWTLNESLGFGLRIPLTNDWTVTPTARLGFGGSLDLCTGGTFASTGVVSAYNYKVGDYVLTMTNYVGYFTSMPLHMGGINFDYHLHDFSYKNGLALTSCEGYTLCGRSLNLSLTFIDTDFEGSPLYIPHYEEVGLTLFTTHVNRCIDYDLLSLGAAYQWGHKGYHGYYLNLVYQF